MSGGTVQTIADDITDPRGASWGPDDTILFGTGYGGVYRVAAAGGTSAARDRTGFPRQEGSHRWPQFLPDGRHFLFTVRSGLAEQRGVYVGASTRRPGADSFAPTRMRSTWPPATCCSWTATRCSPSRSTTSVCDLSGQPTPIAARVGAVQPRERGVFGVEDGNAGLRGRHAAAGPPDLVRPQRDRAGRGGPDGEHDYADFRLSPDETRLAASLVDPKLSVPDIWLTDLVRGGTSRFTVRSGAQRRGGLVARRATALPFAPIERV